MDPSNVVFGRSEPAAILQLPHLKFLFAFILLQSAYGSQALSLSSFFTYVGLGLGLLGSSLSLPFGLYVLICQRTAERYIQDTVSPVSSTQRTATLVAVLAAILILVPMAPELAQEVGVGASNPNLFM